MMEYKIQKAVCKGHGTLLENNDGAWWNREMCSKLQQWALKTSKSKHPSGMKYDFSKCVSGVSINPSRILDHYSDKKKN